MHRGPRGKSSTNNDRAAVAPRQLLGSDRGVGGGPAAPTLSPNPGQAMRVYLYPQHATAATFPQSDIHGMQSRVHATCFLRSLWGGGGRGDQGNMPPPQSCGVCNQLGWVAAGRSAVVVVPSRGLRLWPSRSTCCTVFFMICSAVRRAVKRRAREWARQARASACSCAQGQEERVWADGGATLELAGSVNEYHHHLLIKLPLPPDYAASEAAHGSWWPQLVER